MQHFFNYNARFSDRTEKNSLNSLFIITQEDLMEQEVLHIKICKPHHFSLMKKISRQGQEEHIKAFLPFILHLYNH